MGVTHRSFPDVVANLELVVVEMVASMGWRMFHPLRTEFGEEEEARTNSKNIGRSIVGLWRFNLHKAVELVTAVKLELLGMQPHWLLI
jgi:hypothetical protein